MMFRDLAIATHLIGMIFWVGGASAAAMMAAAAARDGDAGRLTLASARRAVLMLSTPGRLIAWIAGLSYLVPNFTAFYAHAGWMHGKLTLVVIMTGLTGVLTGHLRKAAAGKKPASPGLLGGVGLAIVVTAALIVFLAVLKPG